MLNYRSNYRYIYNCNENFLIMIQKQHISTMQKHVHKCIDDRIIYYCSPTNLNSEKKRFFLELAKGKEYNPVFKYKEIKFNKAQIAKEINSLINFKAYGEERIVSEIDNILFERIVNKYGKRSKNLLGLILSRCTRQFSEISKIVYGMPDKETLKTAKNVLQFKLTSNYSKKTFSANEIAKKLKPIVKKYGWKIILDNTLASKMKTVGSRKELVICSNSEFNAYDITRLKYHEIETHIRRYVNNERLPEEIQTCFNYIETEEGLAITTEEMKNALSAEQLRIYAGRVLGVIYASNHSFYEVFRYLQKHKFNDEDAFTITARVKRGIANTANPGGLTRDHIYLSGKIKVDKFLSNGGSVSDLYLGKIGIDDVEVVKKILR